MAKKKDEKAKEYVCVNPCWHNGRRWRKGQTGTFTDDFPKDAKGNLMHFEEINPAAPPPPPEEDVVIVNEKKRPPK